MNLREYPQETYGNPVFSRLKSCGTMTTYRARNGRKLQSLRKRRYMGERNAGQKLFYGISGNVGKGAIVYLLGGYLLGMLTEDAFSNYWGAALALIVFGTTFFNKVVTFNLFGNHDAVFFFWILKIIISFVVRKQS